MQSVNLSYTPAEHGQTIKGHRTICEKPYRNDVGHGASLEIVQPLTL